MEVAKAEDVVKNAGRRLNGSGLLRILDVSRNGDKGLVYQTICSNHYSTKF